MAVTEYNSGSSYKGSDIIIAGPARLKSVLGYNSKGASQFICLFDANVIPADGTVPKYAILVGANTTFALDFDTYRDFDVGIVWANSSTMPTLTKGSADCWMVIGYGAKINQ